MAYTLIPKGKGIRTTISIRNNSAFAHDFGLKVMFNKVQGEWGIGASTGTIAAGETKSVIIDISSDNLAAWRDLGYTIAALHDVIISLYADHSLTNLLDEMLIEEAVRVWPPRLQIGGISPTLSYVYAGDVLNLTVQLRNNTLAPLPVESRLDITLSYLYNEQTHIIATTSYALSYLSAGISYLTFQIIVPINTPATIADLTLESFVLGEKEHSRTFSIDIRVPPEED